MTMPIFVTIKQRITKGKYITQEILKIFQI